MRDDENDLAGIAVIIACVLGLLLVAVVLQCDTL